MVKKYYSNELYHYGIKGQKWGIRHGPPYPLSRQKEDKRVIIKNAPEKRVSDHKSNPKIFKPYGVLDQVSSDGEVKVRSFYDKHGIKYKDIHLSDHGNPSTHPFGDHGEHITIYYWDKNGSLDHKESREIMPYERERNKDIL